MQPNSGKELKKKNAKNEETHIIQNLIYITKYYKTSRQVIIEGHTTIWHQAIE